ncbi:MAG: hypothetical protein QOJ19_4954 [Acidimicrobiia bacterium]|jgi:hypothetical protein|nr:hypothetical protein [Acidimicrobiia bacterium]
MLLVHAGRSARPNALRVLGAVVALGCLVVVGWNAGSGAAVTDRLLHGQIRKDFDAGEKVTSCFERRVESLVPPGSTVHLEAKDMLVVAMRLTEVMYPRGFLVPDDQPADYVVQATISPTEPTNCDGIALNLRPLR